MSDAGKWVPVSNLLSTVAMVSWRSGACGSRFEIIFMKACHTLESFLRYMKTSTILKLSARWWLLKLFVMFSEVQISNLFYFRPTVGMAFFFWVFQWFLALFVFRDRDFPNVTITVDNRYNLPSLAKKTTDSRMFFVCLFVCFFFFFSEGLNPFSPCSGQPLFSQL